MIPHEYLLLAITCCSGILIPIVSYIFGNRVAGKRNTTWSGLFFVLWTAFWNTLFPGILIFLDQKKVSNFYLLCIILLELIYLGSLFHCFLRANSTSVPFRKIKSFFCVLFILFTQIALFVPALLYVPTPAAPLCFGSHLVNPNLLRATVILLILVFLYLVYRISGLKSCGKWNALAAIGFIIFLVWSLTAHDWNNQCGSRSIRNESPGVAYSLEFAPEFSSTIESAINQTLYDLEPDQLPIHTWIHSLHQFSQITANLNSSPNPESATRESLQILSKLLEHRKVWSYVPIYERAKHGSTIFESIGNLSVFMNDFENVTSFTTSSIVMNQTDSFVTDKWASVELGEAKVMISLEAVNHTKEEEQEPRLTAGLIQELPDYLSFDTLVNSQIVTVAFRNRSMNLDLSPLFIIIEFKNIRPVPPTEVSCVSWNLPESRWTTSGCSFTALSDNENIKCQCDHLAYAYTTIISRTQNGSNIESLRANLTSSSEIDLERFVESLQAASGLVSEVKRFEMNRTEALETADQVLDSFSILIQQPEIWESLNRSEQSRSASSIFNSIEDLSVFMNQKQLESRIQKPNIEMQTKTFNVTKVQNETLRWNFGTNQTFLEIPFQALEPNGSGTISITVTLIDSLPLKLKTGQVKRSLKMNSKILSVVVEDQKGHVRLNQNHKIRFYIQNLEPLRHGSKPQCNYWNYSELNWNQTGCSLVPELSTRDQTVCECTHLTNFAVLVDVSNQEVPEFAKMILTCICSGITIFFTGWTVWIITRHSRSGAYDLVKSRLKMASNRTKLTLNICAWLLITHSLVILALDRSGLVMAWAGFEVLCGLASIALVYSLLTSFSFMLMLSLHLYRSISKRYIMYPFSYRKFALTGYLLPLITIITSLIYINFYEIKETSGSRWSRTLRSLTGDYFCWISSEAYPGHIWIFLGPMSAIILVNFLVFLRILYVYRQVNRKTRKPPEQELLTNGRLINQKPDSEKSNRNFAKILSTYILLFNFGLPWALYVLYINEWIFGQTGAYVFSILFILVNGTQGVALWSEQYYLVYGQRDRKKKTTTNQEMLTLSTTARSIGA